MTPIQISNQNSRLITTNIIMLLYDHVDEECLDLFRTNYSIFI